MGSAHAGRKAAEESSDSFDLLAIVPDALSQDDRDTFAGFVFSVVPRPPFLPLREVENSFGSSELLKGGCEEAESLTLYASQLVDDNQMLVFGWHLQNPLLGTKDYEVILPNSASLPSTEGHESSRNRRCLAPRFPAARWRWRCTFSTSSSCSSWADEGTA